MSGTCLVSVQRKTAGFRLALTNAVALQKENSKIHRLLLEDSLLDGPYQRWNDSRSEPTLPLWALSPLFPSICFGRCISGH